MVKTFFPSLNDSNAKTHIASAIMPIKISFSVIEISFVEKIKRMITKKNNIKKIASPSVPFDGNLH